MPEKIIQKTFHISETDIGRIATLADQTGVGQFAAMSRVVIKRGLEAMEAEQQREATTA